MSAMFNDYRVIGRLVAVGALVLALTFMVSGGSDAANVGRNNPAASTNQGGSNRPSGRNNGLAGSHPAAPSYTQHFQDVPVGSFYYTTTDTLFNDGVVSGFPCNQPPAGPCVPPNNLPYYVPNYQVLRGQMAIYVENTRVRPGIAITTTNPNNNDDYLPVHVHTAIGSAASFYGTTSGNGAARTTEFLNVGVDGYAYGDDPVNHIPNSVAMIGESDHDNGAWFGSHDTSTRKFAGVYIMQNSNGLLVGDPFTSTVTNTVKIYGPLVVAGPKSGYVVDFMQNMGNTDLHPGDIAVATSAGAQAAIIGDIPVAGVGLSSKEYDSSVLGVVDMHWVPGDPSAPVGSQQQGGYYDSATVIHPGEYMGVVTLGAYKAVKVDAANGPIHVGDLLTTSSKPGMAMKVTDKSAAFGAVIGKALGSLDSGSGTIPVMVTLK